MLPRNLNVGVPTHTTARKWKNEAQNRYVVRTIYLAIVYLRPQINLFDFTRTYKLVQSESCGACRLGIPIRIVLYRMWDLEGSTRSHLDRTRTIPVGFAGGSLFSFLSRPRSSVGSAGSVGSRLVGRRAVVRVCVLLWVGMLVRCEGCL